MRIAGGKEEEGVVIGNTYDKYGSKNFLVRRIMRGFDDSLTQLVEKADPKSIHEVGCGEGYWSTRWAREGYPVRGTDFSHAVIDMAREHAGAKGLDQEIFTVRSIYDLVPQEDGADLLVCCEVLEHLEEPERALEVLEQVVRNRIILSVPREPLWRALNVARGHYLADMGNTPGHLQHWSKKSFLNFVSSRFEIEEVRSPLPWTMILARKRT
ncbi:class I SAM-dependent methyltransferase [Spiribacter sp. 221]|uniref:class I SAM-dependent methyltransferase n=1 Tax=Spiribacter onubensis TaxID=3122420 RepID=UPI00349F3819